MMKPDLSSDRVLEARTRYGRSMPQQLLIFLALHMAAWVVLSLISELWNGVFDALINRANNGEMPFEILQTASSVGGCVMLLLEVVVLIVEVCLHRSVTFRSGDSLLHTVLPLGAMTTVTTILTFFISRPFMNMLVSAGLLYWALREAPFVLLLVLSVLVALGTVLLNAGTWLAMGGTIRLARTKGKQALCILPILALLLLLVVLVLMNAMDGIFMTAMGAGRSRSVLSMLISAIRLLWSLISAVLLGLVAFYAQRKLVYRDSCDTAPRTVQQLLAKLPAEVAPAAVAPPAAVSLKKP